MNPLQKLMIDHFDIWTAADNEKKSGRGRSSNNGISVYGIRKLRELILNLAVCGKLVPQDPSDESASKLLRRILDEKAKLNTKGKIVLSPLVEDRKKLFSLPNGWEWAFIPQVVSNDKYSIKRGPFGSAVKKGYFVSSGYKVYEQQHAINDDFSIGNYYLDETKFNELRAFRLNPNDIIISCSGTVGKVAIAPTWMEPGVINQALLKLTLNEKVLTNSYFKILFPAFFMKTDTLSELKGTAQKNIVSVEELKTEPFPLPPVAEQKRIVAKVDELMELCDQLEYQHVNAVDAHEKLVSELLVGLTQSRNAEEFNENWQRISVHFETLFTTESSINALKQTLLQLAVMGKLVPQDPNDEPTSELLKRILRERDKQINEAGLITIANNEVHDSEKYISVPESWIYIRLGNLAKFIDYRGKTPKKVTSGVPLITAKNIKFGYISHEPKEFITSTEYESWMTRGFPRVGDILFTTEAPLGNIAINEITEKFALAQRVICFQLHDQAIASYLKIAIMSKQVQQQFNNAATGMTAAGIKASKLKEISVPIPPMEEQKRIIAKVDELILLCDQVRNRITESQQLQQKLAQFFVEQAKN